MANGQQPAWVNGALVFFAAAAFVSFVVFIHFYTQSSALAKERVILHKLTIPAIISSIDHQIGIIKPLENELTLKQERLQGLKSADGDAQVVNANLLANEEVRVTEIKASVDKISRDFKTSYDETKSAREEHNAQEKEILTITSNLEKNLASLRSSIKEESHGIEGFQKENRATLHELDSGNAKLESRVKELLDQQEISRSQLVADGKILVARAEDGFVILNLGRQSGLRVGTVFKVFSRSGGTNTIKGTVEVTKVDDIQSEAHVLEEITTADPIIAGDSLHNPVFNPDETKVFVVKGVFHNFTKDELSRFITEAGGKVADSLSTKTHYLIAGAGSETDLAEASRYGITILSEDQLIDFIRPATLSR